MSRTTKSNGGHKARKRPGWTNQCNKQRKQQPASATAAKGRKGQKAA